MTEEKTKHDEKEKMKAEVATEDKAKTQDKKPEEKKIVKEKPKKEMAVTRGSNAQISMKHSTHICRLIKGKKIDEAMKILDEVIKMKRAVPFRGEIPHRKGRMMSGRYPINASKEFITLLKGLKGNAVVNGLDPDKVIISSASATWGRRPMRRGSRRAKRTNVTLIVKEFAKEKKE